MEARKNTTQKIHLTKQGVRLRALQYAAKTPPGWRQMRDQTASLRATSKTHHIRGRDKLSKSTDSSGKEGERRGNKRQETPGQKTTLGETKTQDKRCPHISQACGRGGLCGPRNQSRGPGPKKHPSYPINIHIHRTGSRTGLLCTRGHPGPTRENYHPGGVTKARACRLDTLSQDIAVIART